MLVRSLLNRLEPRRLSKRTRRSAPRPRTCRLAVDPLEDRRTPSAMLTVGDVTVVEGTAGVHNAVVTVSITEPHGNSITVNYSTADGTAHTGSDFNAVSGTVKFAINEMTRSIVVPVIGDRVVETDKDFFVRLSNPKGAKIADAEGIVTILDSSPRISIDSYASAQEGNSGTTPMTFTVALSNAYDLPVTVQWVTADGSATAGLDYVGAADTLVFMAGETSKPIEVLVKGDRIAEPDMGFAVNLIATDSYAAISNGVGAGWIFDSSPRISIADVYNYGEGTFTFTVSLSRAYDQDVTVDFATADGTMIADRDYVATLGTLTFKPGEATTQTITVAVLDTTSTDTYFAVHLGGASSNALIANEWAYGYSNYSYYDYYDYGWYDYYYYCYCW